MSQFERSLNELEQSTLYFTKANESLAQSTAALRTRAAPLTEAEVAALTAAQNAVKVTLASAKRALSEARAIGNLGLDSQLIQRRASILDRNASELARTEDLLAQGEQIAARLRAPAPHTEPVRPATPITDSDLPAALRTHIYKRVRRASGIDVSAAVDLAVAYESDMRIRIDIHFFDHETYRSLGSSGRIQLKDAISQTARDFLAGEGRSAYSVFVTYR